MFGLRPFDVWFKAYAWDRLLDAVCAGRIPLSGFRVLLLACARTERRKLLSVLERTPGQQCIYVCKQLAMGPNKKQPT